MISEYSKFRLHRHLRRVKRRSRQRTDWFHARARSQILSRFQRLRPVRGFVTAWWLVWIVCMAGLLWQWRLLGATYMVPTPLDGGTYVEGMVGTVENINPLFAVDGADAAAARLVFNGLMRYDENGVLVTDLAESITVDDSGRHYTVVLRDDVSWHDGQPVSSDDVVFTFSTIQHPDTHSPLAASWRDIQLSAKDNRTIEFVLPNPFSPFPHSLVTGIVPKHLLESFGPTGQRPAEFNQAPIGTGPFRFLKLDTRKGEAVFTPNEDYFRGKPRLERIVLRLFSSPPDMISAYRDGLLSAMTDVPFEKVPELETLERPVDQRNIATANGVFAFYKMSNPILADKAVRQALTQAISPRQISLSLGQQNQVMRLPLLPHQLGFDPNLAQTAFSKEQAMALLDQAGWTLGADGVRVKGDQPLRFSLISQDSSEYRAVSEALQRAWQEIGVAVDLQLYSASDLQLSHLKPHNYDVLIYALDLGADADVFAYWHSSQAAPPGLNLSEYRNAIADDALEAGRTRTDPKLRAAKYRTFVESWRNDIPAAALYNRYFTYAQSPEARTFSSKRFINPADRFNNVEQWTIRLTQQ